MWFSVNTLHVGSCCSVPVVLHLHSCCCAVDIWNVVSSKPQAENQEQFLVTTQLLIDGWKRHTCVQMTWQVTFFGMPGIGEEQHGNLWAVCTRKLGGWKTMDRILISCMFFRGEGLHIWPWPIWAAWTWYIYFWNFWTKDSGFFEKA